MPIIPFREWLPDQAAYHNSGLVKATNVWPCASGYEPVKRFKEVSNALTARPRGAISVVDADGNVYQYAGDTSKLYRNLVNVWTDSSKVAGYATAAAERWEFVHWKNKVIGVNYSDDPQVVTVGGTTFADLTTAMKAKHITKIRDFVVVANTTDVTDGAVPYRVRWCAFNDETDWTVNPDTQADYQDLRVGVNEAIFGGEYGVVLQDTSTWRMSYTGGDTVFQFDEVMPGVGAIAPGAAARDGDFVYFLSHRGFVALQHGTQTDMIGANKVDRTVLNDLDQNHLDRVSAVADPRSHRVLFAYPGAGNTEGRPNKIVIYDRTLDRWSQIEDELELLYESAGIGYTLEGLDSVSGSIDDLGISLDSGAWVGGARELGAFDENFQSGYFDDDECMPATLRTGELEIHEGHYTHLNSFKPVVDGGVVTAKVGVRNRQSDTISWGDELALRASGVFRPQRRHRKAVYHSFEYTLCDNWLHAVGMQILREQAIRGGQRG